MATESERYLQKAHESLASAGADLAAGRCNSAANRAYYAAFQAAVAALIRAGVSSSGDWQHGFVSGEFSGKLIWRRKVFERGLARVLPDLFDERIDADYRVENVSARRAERCVRRANEFVEIIQQWSRQHRASEPPAIYGSDMETTVREPREYAEELRGKIAANFPQARLELQERGATEFTLEVYGQGEWLDDVQELISERRAEILCEHGVWVVVLALDESWRNH